MEKQTVNITLERYEVLIKKEVLFDELMKDKDINVYPYQRLDRLEEVKK